MTGARRQRRLVIQERDRHVLGELRVMRVITREQAEIVAPFGSKSRANHRLLLLSRAGLLKKTFAGTIAGGRKALYTLSEKGAALVGAGKGWNLKGGVSLAGNLYVDHQLQINEIYLIIKYRSLPGSRQFNRWIRFENPLTKGIPLIPDGYFEIGHQDESLAQFLEVDLATETLRVWKKKVDEYLRLAISGEFERLFREKQFRVLVVTSGEKRRDSLRGATARKTAKIFWFTTFEDIQGRGFFSTIWLRPKGEIRHALL